MVNEKPLKPKKLSGFRDFFADEIRIREYVINTFKKVFERYGYEPLETPALEYSNIFTSEVGEEGEKLFYRFKDKGGRDVMLKYEVMISMCRAVAENLDKITFPYKRYQIQNVWRVDRPQKGRFREFTQCDADTIGSDSTLADAEFIQMGIEAMQELGFAKFIANISNRKFLNGLVKYTQAKDSDFIPICLSIDKLPKVGKDGVKKELLEKRKITPKVADQILNIITTKGKTEELIIKFKTQMKDIPIAQEGLKELEIIFNYLKTSNVDPKNYQFAPYIARGLAYYTGPVWEFEILDGDVGSVAGCGRYDNTIGKFAGKRVSATGGSFGIERIVEVLKDRNMVGTKSAPTQVLVTLFDENTINESIKIANFLRQNNISTLLFPDTEKLDKQIKYADKKDVPYVVIIGPDEIKNNNVTLKNLKTGKQKTVTKEELIKLVIK